MPRDHPSKPRGGVGVSKPDGVEEVVLRLFMRYACISTTSEHYMHGDEEELLAGCAGSKRAGKKRVTSGKVPFLREKEAPSGLEPLYEALQASA
jgi:hypothetical protein